MLRALLQEAGRLRQAGRLPSDWVDVLECCEKWRSSTHPVAWGMLEDFALQDLAEPGGSDGDQETFEDGAWQHGGDVEFDREEMSHAQHEVEKVSTTEGIARMTI